MAWEPWGEINPEMGFRNTYSVDTWPSTPILFYFYRLVLTGLHLLVKVDVEISNSV